MWHELPSQPNCSQFWATQIQSYCRTQQIPATLSFTQHLATITKFLKACRVYCQDQVVCCQHLSSLQFWHKWFTSVLSSSNLFHSLPHHKPPPFWSGLNVLKRIQDPSKLLLDKLVKSLQRWLFQSKYHLLQVWNWSFEQLRKSFEKTSIPLFWQTKETLKRHSNFRTKWRRFRVSRAFHNSIYFQNTSEASSIYLKLALCSERLCFPLLPSQPVTKWRSQKLQRKLHARYQDWNEERHGKNMYTVQYEIPIHMQPSRLAKVCQSHVHKLNWKYHCHGSNAGVGTWHQCIKHPTFIPPPSIFPYSHSQTFFRELAVLDLRWNASHHEWPRKKNHTT